MVKIWQKSGKNEENPCSTCFKPTFRLISGTRSVNGCEGVKSRSLPHILKSTFFDFFFGNGAALKWAELRNKEKKKLKTLIWPLR